MHPLRNNLIVKMDESLPTEAGIFIGTNIIKWRDAKDQLGNRGTVISVGPGKRHKETSTLMLPQCKPGDVVRFSELQYPQLTYKGVKYVVINDQDIVGVEV